MTRVMVTLWTVFLATSIGVGLFLLKHEVRVLESELAHLNDSVRAMEDDIHVLEVEWDFLNDPSRLQKLAEKHLSMIPLKSEQLITIHALPAVLLEPQAGTNTWSSKVIQVTARRSNKKVTGSSNVTTRNSKDNKTKEESSRKGAVLTRAILASRSRLPPTRLVKQTLPIIAHTPLHIVTAKRLPQR